MERPVNPTPQGTVILCADGHEVAELLRELHLGELHWTDAIGRWRDGQSVPKLGAPQPLLCHCGAPYFEHDEFPYMRWPEDDQESRHALESSCDECAIVDGECLNCGWLRIDNAVFVIYPPIRIRDDVQ
jgi:hypothetical protein